MCVHIVWMELQLFDIAGFDRGASGLHIMIVFELVFTFRQFAGLPKPDTLVLLLHSGLNGTTPLPTVDVTALTEDYAVRTQTAGTLPGWQASALDVPGQHYASVAVSGLGHRWAILPLFPAP
jgi:hypothetical protein